MEPLKKKLLRGIQKIVINHFTSDDMNAVHVLAKLVQIGLRCTFINARNNFGHGMSFVLWSVGHLMCLFTWIFHCVACTSVQLILSIVSSVQRGSDGTGIRAKNLPFWDVILVIPNSRPLVPLFIISISTYIIHLLLHMSILHFH